MSITKIFTDSQNSPSIPSTPKKGNTPPTQIQSPEGLMSWNVKVLQNGKIDCCPTSPTSREKLKEMKNIIYRFKHEETGKRYGGSALTTVHTNSLKRFSVYNSKVNGDKRRRIEEAVRRSPAKFTVKVILQSSELTEDQLLDLEEMYQLTWETHNPDYGYNVTYPSQEPRRTKRAPLMEIQPIRLNFSESPV